MGNTEHLLRTSSASGNALVLQMVLTGYANADHECWPGLNRLAEDARCGKSTVQRAIDWLTVAEGLEVITNGGPDNPAGDPTNLYRLPEHWFAPSRLSSGQNEHCPEGGSGQNDHERNIYAECISKDTRKKNQVPIGNTNSKQYSSVVKMTTAGNGQNDHCPNSGSRATVKDMETKRQKCEGCGKPFMAKLIGPGEYQHTCSKRCTHLWIGLPVDPEEEQRLEQERERAKLMAALR